MSRLAQAEQQLKAAQSQLLEKVVHGIYMAKFTLAVVLLLHAY